MAIANTLNAQRNSQDDFVTLFGKEYEKLSPEIGLSVIFTSQLKEKVKINASNNEVISILSLEVEDAISRSFNILRSRIDRFGVTQPNIQRLETAGRILVELPGIKDPERARKLLQSTAQLEFWETYEYSDLFQAFESANTYLRSVEEELSAIKVDTLNKKNVEVIELVDEENKIDEESSLLVDALLEDSLSNDSLNSALSF